MELPGLMNQYLPIAMSELPLPALHVASAYRVIDDHSQLEFMRSIALGDDPEPQMFWAADNIWYQAVEIGSLGKAPFLKRFFGPDDLIKVTFKFLPVQHG